MKPSADYLAGLLTIPAVFICFLPGVLFRAYVFCRLWGWFVAPVFGLGSLSLVYGVGILGTMSFVQPSTSPRELRDENEHGVFVAIAHSVVRSAFVLLFAYVLHRSA